MLASKAKILELKGGQMDLYEPCIVGKQKKVILVKIKHAPKDMKLELVHSDVYGPTLISSAEGSKYFFTFIDDSKSKVRIYLLQDKFIVLTTFKRLLQEMR